MDWKEFLKPDLRKVLLFVILLLLFTFLSTNRSTVLEVLYGFPAFFLYYALAKGKYVYKIFFHALIFDIIFWYLFSCVAFHIFNKRKKKLLLLLVIPLIIYIFHISFYCEIPGGYGCYEICECKGIRIHNYCFGPSEKYGICVNPPFGPRPETRFAIENARNTSLTNIAVSIRNTGVKDINMSTIEAYVNDVLVNDDAAGTLTPGSLGNFNISISPIPCDGILTVTEPIGYEFYATIKC